MDPKAASERDEFAATGFRIVRGMLSPAVLAYLTKRLATRQIDKYYFFGDGQVENAFAAYALPVTEALLRRYAPVVSQIIGAEVIPAYSYMRIYFSGAFLARHIDRNSCEVSVTLTINSDGSTVWPIHLEARNGESVRADLSPGDGLIYLGMDLPHWREPFAGAWQTQVFLHFVKAGGPNQSHQFDRRSQLATSPKRRAS